MKPGAPNPNPQLSVIARNLDFDVIFELYTLFGMVIVRIDVLQCKALWNTSDYTKIFEEKLLDKRFGIHDSTYWQSNPGSVFYHVHSDHILAALQSLRNRLSALGLLPICSLYVADFDIMNWRRFHDATAKPT